MSIEHPRLSAAPALAALAAVLLLPQLAGAADPSEPQPPRQTTPASPAASTPTSPTSPAPATTQPAASSTVSDSSQPSAATPNPQLDPTAPKPWTVQIEPLLWLVAPSGNLKLPVTSGSGPGAFTTPGDSVPLASLALDGPRARPAGSLSINADKWRFSFLGADDSNSRSAITSFDTFRIGAVAVAPGDKLDVDFHFGAYEFSAGYMVYENDFPSLRKENAIPVVLKLYALGGVRAYDVSFGVTRTSAAPTASANYDGFFGEPMAGLRAEADFTKSFGIDVQVTGGVQPIGNHTSYSLDIIAGFHYRPTDTLSFLIGYRQLAYDLEDGKDQGNFNYKGRIAGLFFGIDLRF